jgi:hemoglobin
VHIELNANGRRPVSPMRVWFVLAAMVVALLVPTGRSFAQDKPTKTLYQRLGGYDVVAGIVDDFIAQLRDDPAFARFGGGRSLSSLTRTRQLVVDQICFLSGGPCIYIGREMKAAHEGLKITDAEWESSIKKFKVSLDKFKIGAPEQQEFLAMIEKTRPDIVEKPKDEKYK